MLENYYGIVLINNFLSWTRIGFWYQWNKIKQPYKFNGWLTHVDQNFFNKLTKRYWNLSNTVKLSLLQCSQYQNILLKWVQFYLGSKMGDNLYFSFFQSSKRQPSLTPFWLKHKSYFQRDFSHGVSR